MERGKEIICVYSPKTKRLLTEEALGSMPLAEKARFGFGTENLGRKPTYNEVRTSKAQEKAQKQQSVGEFLASNPDATYKQVSDATGVPEATIYRWRKENIV